MRRKFTAAAIVAAFALGGVAAAQTPNAPDLNPVNVTVRLGVSLPLDSELSNLGNTLVDIGAEYIIPSSFLKGSETFVSFDYWDKGMTFSQGSVVALMLNQRWYANSGNHAGQSPHRTYFFLGLGADFIDVQTSNSAIGARGGFGVELGEHLIAEIAGYVSDRAGGARADAVTFSIGYRF